jgi:serine/threonine protein kinase
VQQINLQKVDSKELSCIQREQQIHSQLSHPNIIQFYQFFQQNNNVFMILEFAQNGNLFNHLRKKSYKPEDFWIRNCFRQICLGVQEIHHRGFVHRDIKPENILLDEGLNPKICDFGWAAPISEEAQRNTFCGTYEYIPPEIYENEFYDQRIDVWSLGILLYEMYFQQSPFSSKSVFKIYRNII